MLSKFMNRAFSKYLLATNTFIGITFATAGDVIQQFVEKKFVIEKPYEFKRTQAMSITGLVYAPIAHAWYSFLDFRYPGNARSSILKKLVAEIAAGPFFILAMFMGIGYLKNKPANASFEDFKKNVLTICVVDWFVYIPLQALNFYFLPPRYRVLYVCTITLGYDIFLSYIVHKEENARSIKARDIN